MDMEAYCKCNKCGKDAKVDTSMVLTSNPPKFKYECSSCGNINYIETEAIYNTPHARAIFSNTHDGYLSSSSNSYLNDMAFKKECSTCSHNNVCKYKDEFMKKLNSLDLAVDSFIRLSCECVYYSSNRYNTITYRNLPQYGDYTSINADDCSNCDFRKKLLTDGTYIGDAPCDFCSKNPYKITCLNSIKNTDTSDVLSINTNSSTLKSRQIINETNSSNICTSMEDKNV